MQETNTKALEKKTKKQVHAHSYKSLKAGIHLIATITGYIIGPIIVFGGIGLWLDKHFHMHKLVLLGFIGIAFIISNTLIVMRVKKMAHTLSR